MASEIMSSGRPLGRPRGHDPADAREVYPAHGWIGVRRRSKRTRRERWTAAGLDERGAPGARAGDHARSRLSVVSGSLGLLRSRQAETRTAST